MHVIETTIQGNLLIALAVLLVAFLVLAKGANLFVDSAVALADRSGIPRLLIGIVLVSLATTAPELAVSMMSAARGNPEMALGNAIGSVICDDGLALGLAGVLAAKPVLVIPAVLKTSGLFLLGIQIVLFFLLFFDRTLGRMEGGVLVLLFAGYVTLLYRMHRSGKLTGDPVPEAELEKGKHAPLRRLVFLFLAGIAGIVVASEFIVGSAQALARGFGISEAIIGLTIIAFGTSIPEVATCVTAVRKNQGDIAIGNIIGADILNICWVAGASALVNDLVLSRRELSFMLPSMFIMVGAMLLLLRHRYRLTRIKGVVLLGLYVAYLAASFLFFPPQLPG